MLQAVDGRTRQGRCIKRMLALVETYEADERAARERSSIDRCEGELLRERMVLKTVRERIFKEDARTMDGVLVMARALKASPMLDLSMKFAAMR